MDDFLWGFLGAIAGAAVGVPVLAYLGRTVIDHWLSRRLERLKNTLQRDTETALEHLRTDLRVAAHEREVRFSRYHEQQVTVLSELYRLLARAYHTHGMLSLFPDDQEARDRALSTRDELWETFDSNQIFLPDGLIQDFRAVLEVFVEVYRISLGLDSQDPSQALHAMQDQAPVLLRAIQERVKLLLTGE